MESIRKRLEGLTTLQKMLLVKYLDTGESSDSPNPPQRLVAYFVGENHIDVEGLRSELARRLPKYMMPADLIQLDSLPRLPNGKVDLVNLPVAGFGRATEAAAIAEPTTDTEEKLLRIWEEVLNFQPIGVDDNFFEIGGDSILSIQIVGRARKLGIVLAPNQIFEHQTVAELARFAGIEIAPSEEAQESSGTSYQLSPIQHWFFEDHTSAPHFWNQAVGIDLPHGVEAQIARDAIGVLVDRHDILRSRFQYCEGRWQARLEESSPDDLVVGVDLEGVERERVEQRLSAELKELQSGVDLANSPLFRALHLNQSGGQGNRIVFVAHHLIVDSVSWEILIREFVSAAEAMASGVPVKYDQRPVSYGRWSSALYEIASSGTYRGELDFWRSQSGDGPVLHTDFTVHMPLKESGIQSKEIDLDEESTRRLLREVPVLYNIQTEELLIAALCRTLCDWNDQDEVQLGLERRGRDDLGTGINLNETVGWFTTYFPVKMELEHRSDGLAVLDAVKRHLRSIPNGGIGYGILRYLDGDDDTRESLEAHPEVIFNYLGSSFDNEFSQMGGEIVSEAVRHPNSERWYLLEFNAFLKNGSLVINCSFSKDNFRTETIEVLLSKFALAIKDSIERCLATSKRGYSPSDFPEADLDQKDLDNILDQIEI